MSSRVRKKSRKRWRRKMARDLKMRGKSGVDWGEPTR
jgi:hypothetical protein